MGKRFRFRNFSFPKISKYILICAVLVIITGLIYPTFSSELTLIGKLGLVAAYLVYGIEGYFWFYDKTRFVCWIILPLLAWIHYTPDASTVLAQGINGIVTNAGYYVSLVSLLAILIVIVINCSYNKRRWLFTGTVNIAVILVVFTLLNPVSALFPVSPSEIQGKNTITTTPTSAITNVPSSIFDITQNRQDISPAIEDAIFRYTNEERQKSQRSPLQYDRSLSAIARAHSTDMAQNDFFSHTNLKGEDPTDRATRSGYSVHKELGSGWYSEGIAENIGKMPTGNVVGIGYVSSDPDSIAKAQVNSWMTSPGHRSNILNSQYSRIGVGVSFDGMYYISTQNFW
ncbi:MAG: Cysteine-rich secretory protein family protein [Methanoregula sp. PtaU1.Bin051]|nr:MAG: Cysteine-rich secretory protein family protein [Methanoregula sp. PtaU1.Bin051]